MFAIFYGFNDTEFFSILVAAAAAVVVVVVNFTRHGIYKVSVSASSFSVHTRRQPKYSALDNIVTRRSRRRWRKRQRNFRTIDTKPIECNIFRSDYNVIAISNWTADLWVAKPLRRKRHLSFLCNNVCVRVCVCVLPKTTFNFHIHWLATTAAVPIVGRRLVFIINNNSSNN